MARALNVNEAAVAAGPARHVLALGVAAGLGVLGGVLSATGRPEIILIVLALILAGVVCTSRSVVFWFVLIGALVVTGLAQLYLPQARYVRYVVPVASCALLLHWVMDYFAVTAADRQRPVPAPMRWALAFALIGIVSSLVNLSAPGVMFVGLKDYFQMWVFFFGLAFLRWNPALFARAPTFLLFIALLQLPVAAHQYLVLAPQRIGLGGGRVPVDVVAGTFGASLYGGGANAVLAVFMVIVVGCLVALWKHGALSAWKAALVAPLVLSPLLFNEAKISALYLPLGFLVIFYGDMVLRPIRFMVASVLGAVLLAVLLTALVQGHPSGQVKNWSELLDLTIQQQTSHVGARDEEYNALTRVTALTFWAKEHVRANPINTLVGHGLGASRVQERGLDLAYTLAEKRYGGLQIGFTGIAALLWDVGVLGLIAVLGMYVSAFRLAGWLSHHYRDKDDGFKAGLFQGLQAAVAVLTLSLAHKDFFVSHIPYQTLTYLIIGFIAWSWRAAVHNSPYPAGPATT